MAEGTKSSRQLVEATARVLDVHPRMVQVLVNVGDRVFDRWMAGDDNTSSKFIRLATLHRVAIDGQGVGLDSEAFLLAVSEPLVAGRSILSLIWEGADAAGVLTVAQTQFQSHLAKGNHPRSHLKRAFRKELGPINDATLTEAMANHPELVTHLIRSGDLNDLSVSMAVAAIGSRPDVQYTDLLLEHLISRSLTILDVTLEALFAFSYHDVDRAKIKEALRHFEPATAGQAAAVREILAEDWWSLSQKSPV